MPHVDYEVDYPKNFPLAALSDAGRIIRGGLIREEKACFKKDVWIVDGYVSLQVLGEPTDHPLIGAVPGDAVTIETEAECCDAIDAVVASQSGADGTVKAINPLTLLAIAQMLLKLWQEHKDK